jgi:hypothetical protein
VLSTHTDTNRQFRRPGRPATVSALIARCDALCFPAGIAPYIAPAERIRRIRACAVEQLNHRYPPSESAIEKFYERRAVAATRWWRHELLELAVKRAFPAGVIPMTLTNEQRNDRILAECERILDDGFAAEHIQLPSPRTIGRFLKSRAIG